MRAAILIRDQPHYRADAFHAGLQALGYQTITKPFSNWAPSDLLVIWNRKRGDERLAEQVEAAGGRVLVAENGYVGADDQGRQYYAIALGGHCGSGRWHVGEEDRFAELGIELAPYRTTGGHILVCGQRGIGSRTMASPPHWHDRAAKRVRQLTGGAYEVRVRLHPGRHKKGLSLQEDLEGARAVVIWSSSSGVKAMIQGIPVFFDAPHWICREGAGRIGDIGSLCSAMSEDRRRQALHRMAWAQWSIGEIEEGMPFRHLLAL